MKISKAVRKYVILQVVLLKTIGIYGQIFTPDPAGLDYFIRGSELINLGDYKGADSLLTLAMCSYKNENVYFNRAVSKLLQSDTCGYCNDISVAANKYFDKQADTLFNALCCERVDTIYYDKKRIISDRSKYRYYEIIRKPKYDSVIYGSYHDIKAKELLMNFDYGCDTNLLGLNSSTSDMIAGYIIEDSVKYYYKSTKQLSTFNIAGYEDLKRRAAIALSSKYTKMKTDNEKESLLVYFKVYFDREGEVIKVHLEGIFPELNYEVDMTELEEDLLKIAFNYPKFYPAKFFTDPVCFVTYDYVEF